MPGPGITWTAIPWWPAMAGPAGACPKQNTTCSTIWPHSSIAMMADLDRSRPASGATRPSVTSHPVGGDHHGSPAPDAAACAHADTAAHTPENAADLSSRMPPSARILSFAVSGAIYYEP